MAIASTARTCFLPEPGCSALEQPVFYATNGILNTKIWGKRPQGIIFKAFGGLFQHAFQFQQGHCQIFLAMGIPLFLGAAYFLLRGTMIPFFLKR